MLTTDTCIKDSHAVHYKYKYHDWRKVKKTIALIALTTIGITACGSKTVYISDTTAKPTDTTIRTTTTQYEASIEDIYLSVIYNEFPQTRQLGESYMIELGQIICDEIDGGMTAVDLTIIAMQMELDTYAIGYIAGAAIEAFCPWNDWFYESL